MSIFKKALALLLVVALTATIAVSATLAYLVDEESQVNVMTLGNVEIEQHEYERVVDNNGDPVLGVLGIDFTENYGITQSYKLQKFHDGKPAYPAVYTNDKKTTAWDEFQQLWNQVGAPGSNDLFDNSMKNVVDKFVFVENTGKSDCYYRTLIAIEWPEDVSAKLLHVNFNSNSRFTGITQSDDFDGTADKGSKSYYVADIKIDGINYRLYNVTYNQVLTPGEVSRPSLLQFYLDPDTNNDDCAKFGPSWEVLVVSQAVQTMGFADATTALDTAFGDTTPTLAAEWFAGVYGVQVDAANIGSIDFTVANKTFNFTGEFDDVTINELGEGSVISFDDATIGNLEITDDAIIEGSAKISSIKVARNSAEPIEFTIRNANLDVEGEISTKNTDGLSVLNIENSRIESGNIFVGEHTNNCPKAQAELNIINSYVSCEENGLGSTISAWGRAGVQGKIYDSEIYTYSRGWHQSEDANDNAITFQGATNLDVDIQRSNMHLYGARSIINVRQYGGEDTTVNARINESIIWVVTKSSHGENTLPVWGFGEDKITDSMLLFTKNVHNSTPAVFKSFVYGNPVIHGEYRVTTQCQWDAPIALADGQTVTFASDANVTIYDGAGKVEFTKTGSAKVILEAGAVVKNIGGIQ